MSATLNVQLFSGPGFNSAQLVAERRTESRAER